MLSRSGLLAAILGRVAAVAISSLLIAAILGSPSARALVPNHPFLYEVSGSQPSTAAGEFDGACGVAVDDHGYIYLADYSKHRIEILDYAPDEGPPPVSSVTRISAVDPLDGPCGLAVDSNGNLYVNNWHRNVVKYTPSSY